MTGPAPEITVVIPSLGRDSLVRCVRTALDQDDVQPWVIVADDSGTGAVDAALAGARDLDAPRESGQLRVLETGGGARAAGARTLGMGAARTPLVALCDDDDLFLPGHLARACAHLAGVPAPALYACREVLRTPDGGRLQPGVLQEDGTVADYLYADAAWRTRSRGLSMSTLVMTGDLAAIPMLHSEQWAEDTDWLLQAGARGARLRVDGFIGGVRTAAMARDAERGASRDAEAWQERVAQHATPRHVAALLIGREGREAVRRGSPREVLALHRQAWRADPDLRWLVPTALHTVVAAARGGARRLRRPTP